MKVKVNDKEMEISAATVADFAKDQKLPATGVAVAINNQLVPRAEWDGRAIVEGDDIVILKAFCGG